MKGKVLSLIFIISFVICIDFVKCANILIISTLASPSHQIWNEAYIKVLLEKGHNVTILTQDDSKIISSNFTVIKLEGVYEQVDKGYHTYIDYGPINTITMLWEWSSNLCELDIKTKGLKSLLEYPEDYVFDLIIWDLNTGQCLYPLIDRFGSPPVIATSAFSYQHYLADIFGQIFTYIPYTASTLSDKMTFLERFKNTIWTSILVLMRKTIYLPHMYYVAQEFFDLNIRPFEEVERSVSLILVNNDHIVGYPQLLPPNVIPVGGLHLKPSVGLPKSLSKITEEAENGVIYFALGTNLHPEQFGKEKIEKFIEVFAKLPYTIIWKFNDETIKTPKNVILKKWLPQSDILAHPKTKLFITHCGLLSTQETIYHGVPTVGMPFFLDQINNMAFMERNKIGKKLDFNVISTEIIYETIMEVLQDPIYKNNAQKLSSLYKERAHASLDSAIYWIEYVLKHGQLDHLNVASRDMYFWETLNLDIIFVLLILLFLIVIIPYKIISNILKRRVARDLAQNTKKKD